MRQPRVHTISEADKARVLDETYTVLIASGEARSGKRKRLTAVLYADTVVYTVGEANDTLSEHDTLASAIEEYNEQ